MWVQNRLRGREVGLDLVVIGDHKIQSQSIRHPNFMMGVGPTI